MIPLILAAALSSGAPKAIVPIVLHPGVNTVPGFTADGRSADVVVGWRDNGNAHGYDTFMVLAADPSGRRRMLVAVQGPQHPDDLVRDDPFDGEREVGAVRFARANLDGRRQTVLVTAQLDPTPSGVLADHATATVKVYRLVHEQTVGAPPDRFEVAWSATTTKRYCNVQLALRDVLGIPLSRDYSGANRVDGCF